MHKLKVVCLFLALLVIGWAVVEYIRPFLNKQYGIDPIKVAFVFLIAEFFFNIGLAMMLWFSGIKHINWQTIRSFKFKEFRVNRDNPGMVLGLFINRLSWTAPFSYILVIGIGKLPWLILVACLIEILITVWIGLLVFGLYGKAKPKVIVRIANENDIEAVVGVDNRIWGEIFPGNREMFSSRVNVFHDGGLIVAEVEGKVEAFVSTQLIFWNDWFSDCSRQCISWNIITDYGTLRKTHNPQGFWLYGVGIASTPNGSSANAIFHLFTYLGKLIISNNYEGVILFSRIPGYKRFLEKAILNGLKELSPHEYVLARHGEHLLDPELRIYSKFGISVVTPSYIVKDYMGPESDPESCDFSVLVRWRNPFYNKPRFLVRIISWFFKA